ncbi:hypothetical protein A45J_1036 [hot springs metagenome]|uniref:Flagellar hook-length control protein-like C-terminal domain-containing protein n=1 Tax=hot springs metagenome TaxID=433727 RepID=A0A5J4L4Y2_9ZZZZ
MINFKITGLNDTFISIEKPAGKSIALKLGEIVKAEVMDVLPSGGITLKIKGDFITAKTEVPLEKGTVAFFKVTDLPAEGKDLRLQFMGYETNEIRNSKFEIQNSTGKDILKLMKELENSLKNNTTSSSKFQTLNSELLKSLPHDINSIPKEIRIQLQNLLQASLKITGQSIQARLDNFISQLPEGIKNHPVVQNLAKDLMVSVEKLLQTPMKDILQDTGVVLEAKIRTIVEMFKHMEYSEEVKTGAEKLATGESKIINSSHVETPVLPQDKGGVTGESKHVWVQHDMAFIKKDLKAELLQLKQYLASSEHELTISQKEGVVRAVDGLIKDIETFQVLSKATDSFYTFLPINWHALRDGEVSFKRGRSDARGISYSCRVNLDLERFGSLSILIMIYNKEFLVSFRVENPEFQKIISNNIKELQDSFIARGLNLKAVNIMDSNDAKWEQFENLESGERQISIKI